MNKRHIKLKNQKKKIGKGLLDNSILKTLFSPITAIRTATRPAVNVLIDKVPYEVHLPGYQYCGPGTKLEERLKRGDPGINKLDQACKRHDIEYTKSNDEKKRKMADILLLGEAAKRIRAKDASIPERLAAIAVTGAMGVKSGFGLNKRSNTYKKIKMVKGKPVIRDLIKIVKAELQKTTPSKNMNTAIKLGLKAAKTHMMQYKGKHINKNIPRIIPVPKIGGVLPLIPIFAGLSAIGSLIGGSAAVAKAINTTNEAKKSLKENQRHNQVIEAIALGKQNKQGQGVYLRPYKTGLGLYLNTQIKQKNL